MNCKFLLFTWILFCLQLVCLQVKSEVNISKNTQFSLLTCSSGDELYSTFGHSALRVYDDSLGIDVVFNYGTFDFDTPNFYMKFANGELDYMLSTTTYNRFLISYRYEQRTVKESVINLKDSEKSELWSRLMTNIRPENRAYRYDFFFDNCATRIRNLIYDIKGIDDKLGGTTEERTFREYLHECLPINTWCSQGIDLILGMDCDRCANDYERAFLPIYLYTLFTDNKIIDDTKFVVYSEKLVGNESSIFTPFVCGLLLLLLTITISIYEIRRKTYYRWFDISIFTISSILSILFWYMWLVSDLQACSNNLNVLWASILYIPLLFFVIKKHNSIYLCRLTISIIFASDIAFILLNIFCVQYAPLIAYCLMSILFIRLVLILKRR